MKKEFENFTNDEIIDSKITEEMKFLDDIKISDEKQDKIINSIKTKKAKKKKFKIISYSALAACLALLVAVSPSIYSGFQKMNNDKMTAEYKYTSDKTAAEKFAYGEAENIDSPSIKSSITKNEADVIDSHAVADVIDSHDIINDYIFKAETNEDFSAGTLTCAELNDNENWNEFLDVCKAAGEYTEYLKMYSIYPLRRIKVTVKSGEKPLNNVTVEGKRGDNTVWTAKTDNNGIAYIFNDPYNKESQNTITSVSASVAGKVYKVKPQNGNAVIDVDKTENKTEKSLDLMLVFDTTGSMGDELYYLQTELEDIINSVKKENQNTDINLSVNFYRDDDDEYVVKPSDFTNDIKAQISLLKEQIADGGGDYEEAVEKALENAVFEHNWREDATAKVMIMILDAPPHNSEKINSQIQKSVSEAAKKGIRIVPVLSSEAQKDAEVLMRNLSVLTGGTYVFLTDDSGYGGTHTEATTAVDYEVEAFNKCLIRIINNYLK